MFQLLRPSRLFHQQPTIILPQRVYSIAVAATATTTTNSHPSGPAGESLTASSPSPSSNFSSTTTTATTAASNSYVQDAINRYSQYKQTPVSIKQFAEFGRKRDLETAIKSINFLQNELPVRLAHMMKEIESLPERMLQQPAVSKVHGWYLQSFKELVDFAQRQQQLQQQPQQPPQPIGINAVDQNIQIAADFTQLIKNIHRRHSPVVTTMAQGIVALKEVYGASAYDRNIQYFLDRFYMSRIGIRVLIAQHIEVFGEYNLGTGTASGPTSANKGWVGVIDEKCDVRTITEDAAENARFLCNQYYFSSPEVQIVTPRADVHFPYIPSHLYHMLFELLKNSMRAVVEHHGPDAVTLPKVRVIIMKGEEDMTIKISDEGGGVPRSGMPHLFTYFYSTAKPPQLEPEYTTDMNHAPLAGFGYGLPLSRLYARYFGGDLNLISMEGFGTDAYIYLKVAAHEAGEVLPSYSRNSKLQAGYQQDWMQAQIMRSLYTSAKLKGAVLPGPYLLEDVAI